MGLTGSKVRSDRCSARLAFQNTVILGHIIQLCDQPTRLILCCVNAVTFDLVASLIYSKITVDSGLAYAAKRDRENVRLIPCND
jgi:hypothetical protein